MYDEIAKQTTSQNEYVHPRLMAGDNCDSAWE